MTTSASQSARVPGYTLISLGLLLLIVGYSSGSLPLDVLGCIPAFFGAQSLLWSGALAGYRRKRAGAILLSVLSLGFGLFLVGIRVYAGPAAWSG